MNEPLGPDCERFDAHAEDLALGHVEEPLRGTLLAHAAACPHCHSLLDGLVTVTDRLLLAAPEVEPPAGFETRVLARLDDPVAAPAAHWPRWVVAAAAAVVVLLGGVVVAAQLVGDDDGPAEAAIVSATGDEVGTVALVDEPTAHVLISIGAPRPGPGVRVCELQSPDGTWHEVGSWEAADIYTGVWAAGIDDDLLDATAMRVIADGAVVATARFD